MAETGGWHGFDDDEATRKLLRSPPSPAALAWVEETTGDRVRRWSVLRGGTSSAMYSVEFEGMIPLVLRCYVRPELNEEEPDLAHREAAALRTAEDIALPTPQLVAVDPTGADAAVPAVLMSRLPGRLVWDPTSPKRWLERLASVLPVIHEAGEVDPAVGRYFNHQQRSYEPPQWAQDRGVWEQAIEVFHGPVLDEERCFIHRDFHPGNVLWHRGSVTGVVDWQSSCVGPPSVDVAHCRANLLLSAPELTEEFTGAAERATGRTFHPWGDIACIIGMLDGLRATPPGPAARSAIEAALAVAVAACTT